MNDTPPPPADFAEIGRAHANELEAHEWGVGEAQLLWLRGLVVELYRLEPQSRAGKPLLYQETGGKLWNLATDLLSPGNATDHKTTKVKTAINQRLFSFLSSGIDDIDVGGVARHWRRQRVLPRHREAAGLLERGHLRYYRTAFSLVTCGKVTQINGLRDFSCFE